MRKNFRKKRIFEFNFYGYKIKVSLFLESHLEMKDWNLSSMSGIISRSLSSNGNSHKRIFMDTEPAPGSTGSLPILIDQYHAVVLLNIGLILILLWLANKLLLRGKIGGISTSPHELCCKGTRRTLKYHSSDIDFVHVDASHDAHHEHTNSDEEWEENDNGDDSLFP